MKQFDAIKQILEDAVLERTIGVHGNFWRAASLEQFKGMSVRGRRLIVAGDAENSNLIKALEGRPPFDGTILPQMPLQDERGFRLVPPERVAFIRAWIDAGCPDADLPGTIPPLSQASTVAGASPGAAAAARVHGDFWLALDQWSMFAASEDIANAVDNYQNVVGSYVAMLRNSALEPGWAQAVKNAQADVTLLCAGQLEIVRRFYGDPINIDGVCESFELFGRDELPADPRHGSDPHHRMDGKFQWIVWTSFADAAGRLNLDAATWRLLARAILAGMLNDGLFRADRFIVTGFTKDAAGKQAIDAYVKSLADTAVMSELAKRILTSGLI